jgi:acyl dehydratase
VIAAGDALPPWVLAAVSAEAMRELAPILDDPNPIHLDGAAAARAGLGDRPVNQGPANIGYVVTMLRRALPDATLVRLTCRLTGTVVAGDRVVAGGDVLEVAGPEVVCAVWLDVDGAHRAVEGTARLRLPET